MVKTVSRKLVAQLAEMIIEGGAKQVTKYLSPKLTVKATRQGKVRTGDSNITLLLTIGRPNYAERKFIKACMKAGEPFPVKRTQIKWPKKSYRVVRAGK